MRALVTGATGFVGKKLVEELINQGAEVLIIVRNPEYIPMTWDGKVRVVVSVLESLSSLNAEELGMNNFDVFFHLAWAGTSGRERGDEHIQLANVQYTCDAVKLARRLNCKKFIYAGSIMEYEAMEYVPNNGSEPGKGCIYSIAKLTADFMAKTIANHEKISYINLIISNIYGEGEYSERFLVSTIRKMINGEDIPLTHGKQLYDFIHIDDAVRAMLLVAEKGENNESYYIGNDEQRPLREYLDEMYSVLNSKSRLGYGEVPYKNALLTYKEFDTNKLSNIGFVPKISFNEGVSRIHEWIIRGENEY